MLLAVIFYVKKYFISSVDRCVCVYECNDVFHVLNIYLCGVYIYMHTYTLTHTYVHENIKEHVFTCERAQFCSHCGSSHYSYVSKTIKNLFFCY